MDIIETKVKELSKTESFISMVLADNKDLGKAEEIISFTVRVKYNATPLLQAVQTRALSRVQDLADEQMRGILGLPNKAL